MNSRKCCLAVFWALFLALVAVPAEASGGMIFKKVTAVSAGKRYVMAALTEGGLKLAGPLAESQSTGFLPATAATATDDVITLTDETPVFTFQSAGDDAYYIVDSEGRYLTHTAASADTFGTAAEASVAGAKWVLSGTASGDGPGPATGDDMPIVGDGQGDSESSGAEGLKIVNQLTQSYIQYVSASDAFGCYATEMGVLPELYEEMALKGDVNRDGEVTIADLTALVNILLGKATEKNDSDRYDFEAVDVNGNGERTVADVTALVNILLGKKA